jgi:hypothetical protein
LGESKLKPDCLLLSENRSETGVNSLSKMKLRAKAIHRNLPPLKLYLEDLEYVIQLLNSISSEVIIRTDEHEFESLSELSQTKQKVFRNLEIRSSDPRISLDLSTRSSYLHLIDNLPASKGVFEQIYSHV